MELEENKSIHIKNKMDNNNSSNKMPLAMAVLRLIRRVEVVVVAISKSATE
jgi:hypothetical protein